MAARMAHNHQVGSSSLPCGTRFITNMPYKNKEDQKKCAKRHYENNKVAYLERAVVHKKYSRDAAGAFIDTYLLNHPCVDCGQDNIIVLDFDHVRGIKKGDVASYASYGWSIVTIKEEINKCDIRCANCHRIVTHKRKH